MALPAGTRLGSFEIHSLLGAGGMGEVYRARDTRLGRDVALKVLPGLVASEPDRLARLEREARILATLNHPHIGSIYGLEVAGDVHALVLELVEGPLLADRIARGPLPLEEAVRIAAQIAEALEAAHERGIVHRDLKPGNVKLDADGRVKVLDFGLARGLVVEAVSHSPDTTVAHMLTEHGMVLGTAAYMAPEQARGQTVDRRADIWSFGCVLFEMLTGRSPFTGATMSDVLVSVLERDPAWDDVPADTPAHVRWVLRRCLEKDAARRLRDIGEARLALTEPATIAAPVDSRADSTPTAGATARGWSWSSAALGVAGGLAAAGALWATGWTARQTAGPATAVRFELTPPAMPAESTAFAVSPDGRELVYAGTSRDGVFRLWVRTLDSLEVRPLAGSDGELTSPVPLMTWSPDNRHIAFYSAGSVKRIERVGGVSRIICSIPGVALGGAWNEDGQVLVGNTAGGVMVCPAAGGTATPVTQATNDGPQQFHAFPAFLPGGRRFIYLRVSRANPASSGLMLGDLDLPADRQSDQPLMAAGLSASFVPSAAGDVGHLVTVRDGTLVAIPFDTRASRVSGDAVPLIEGVGSYLDSSLISVAAGTLVYRGGAPEYRLEWVDRRGGQLTEVGERGPYSRVALSPDGERVVVSRDNSLNRAERDLWTIDVPRNTMTRLTSDNGLESMPTFLGDAQVVFARGAGRASDLFRVVVGGTSPAEVLADVRASGLLLNPVFSTMSATRDGRFLIVTAEGTGETRADIWMLPTSGGAPVPLIRAPFDQSDAWMAPNERWLAYVSNDSGANDIFISPLVKNGDGAYTVGERRLVARRAIAPRWRADSAELFFQSTDGGLAAVPVTGTTVGSPVEMFRTPGILDSWGIAPDGQRFLLAKPAADTTTAAFTVVLNWQSLYETPSGQPRQTRK